MAIPIIRPDKEPPKGYVYFWSYRPAHKHKLVCSPVLVHRSQLRNIGRKDEVITFYDVDDVDDQGNVSNGSTITPADSFKAAYARNPDKARRKAIWCADYELDVLAAQILQLKQARQKLKARKRSLERA